MKQSLNLHFIENNIVIFQFRRQYKDSTNPAVYINFEQDECWVNHGVQFVTELPRISSVSDTQY